MVADHVLDRFELQCGLPTQGLRLRYEVHGRLNEDRSNAVLFPTWFAGRHEANRWIIGPGRGLDTSRLCVIVVNALGNGESSSPSNDPQLIADEQPVALSLYDNVRAQYQLVRSLGIETLHAVVGRSMGAQQALQWGCLYPHRVRRVFALCGVPRTTAHNRLLLDAMLDALQRHGPDATAGLRLAARIYAAWCYSHEFFSGADDAGQHRERAERQVAQAFDAFDSRDLSTLLCTWRGADISDNPVFRGDLRTALASISARTLLVPISHDLIFPPRDFEQAQACIPACESHLLYSTWGHRAAAPRSSEEDIARLGLVLGRFMGTQRPNAFRKLSLLLGM